MPIHPQSTPKQAANPVPIHPETDQQATHRVKECRDALMLHSHREALQGRVKECRGGKSATMVYSYPYTLCRRAVVVTMDLSASNLAYFTEHPWLSDRRNVIALRLREPVWA